jgi:hypothetical protein
MDLISGTTNLHRSHRILEAGVSEASIGVTAAEVNDDIFSRVTIVTTKKPIFR